MHSTLLDKTMDLAVVPGYSALGYRVRARSWGPRVPAGSLAGRDVLVTGGSSGIGEAACRQLAEANANVHLLARDRARGEAARDRVAASGSVELHLCDVSDLESVRAFARGFARDVGELAGIVHNAGVLTPERRQSAQGIELTFATAVAGPYLMTGLLRGVMRGSPRARVVFVTSGGMFTSRLDLANLQLSERDFDGPRFYAHAKRAQVVLASALAEREPAGGIGYHSMHPGWADTPGLARSLPRFHGTMRSILRDSAQGADTAVWLLACAEAGDHPGALWHDRRARSAHRLPWTRESAADREGLLAELERMTSHPAQPEGRVVRP